MHSSDANNCVLVNNISSESAGGGSCGGKLNNCTIYDNTGGGANSGTLENCIVFRNGSYDVNADVETFFCYTNNPHFVDAENMNLQLMPSSPCIDSGNNICAPTNVVPYDLAGNPRIANKIVDLGAYEYQPPCSYQVTPDSTNYSYVGGNGLCTVSCGDECEWTATTTADWITLGGAQSTGSGQFSIGVGIMYDAGVRTGKVFVADQTVVVTQQGGPVPRVNIATTTEVVRSSSSEIQIGGTANSNTVGYLHWMNSLTQDSGTVAVSELWLFSVNLDEGSNRITVSGSNVIGIISSDSLTVTRAGVPYLTVTNGDEFVPYETALLALGGVQNNLSELFWTNALTGSNNAIAVSVSAYSASVPLGIGTNLVTVYGANIAGEQVSEKVTIIRDDQDPILSVTPLPVRASAILGRDHAVTATFKVCNIGGRELRYSLNYSLNSWFARVEPAGGTGLTRDQSCTHVLTFMPGGLELGEYINSIEVMAVDGAVEPPMLENYVKLVIRKSGGLGALMLLLFDEQGEVL